MLIYNYDEKRMPLDYKVQKHSFYGLTWDRDTSRAKQSKNSINLEITFDYRQVFYLK